MSDRILAGSGFSVPAGPRKGERADREALQAGRSWPAGLAGRRRMAPQGRSRRDRRVDRGVEVDRPRSLFAADRHQAVAAAMGEGAQRSARPDHEGRERRQDRGEDARIHASRDAALARRGRCARTNSNRVEDGRLPTAVPATLAGEGRQFLRTQATSLTRALRCWPMQPSRRLAADVERAASMISSGTARMSWRNSGVPEARRSAGLGGLRSHVHDDEKWWGRGAGA